MLPNPMSIQPRLTIRQNLFTPSTVLNEPNHHQDRPRQQFEVASRTSLLEITTGAIADPSTDFVRDESTLSHMDGVFLAYKGYRYYRDGQNFDKKTQCQKIYWRCSAYKRNKCRARLHSDLDGYVLRTTQEHLPNCKLLYPRSFESNQYITL